MGQYESDPDPRPVMRTDDPCVVRVLPHAVQPGTRAYELGLKLAEVELDAHRYVVRGRDGRELEVRRGFRYVSDDFVDPGPWIDFDPEGIVREGFGKAAEAGYTQEQLLAFVNECMRVASHRMNG